MKLLLLFVLIIILIPVIIILSPLILIYAIVNRYFEYKENIKGLKKEKKKLTSVNPWAEKFLKDEFNNSKKGKQDKSIS